MDHASDTQQICNKTMPDYDRKQELKAFDDTKEGVKGLVDAGLKKIPRIFIKPPDHDLHDKNMVSSNCDEHNWQIPVINLEQVMIVERRKEIIDQLRHACETRGFFQVINHGIPIAVIDEMIEGVRRFHEQPKEEKMKFYSRDEEKRKVMFNTNFDLYKSSFANWRDSLQLAIAPNPPKPEEFPAVCRDITIKYCSNIMKLSGKLMELLSEALGLNPNHLNELGCSEGLFVLGHYYPACPEPELTMGATKHCDNDFLTILLQDQIGGLQVLHQNKWVNVPPVHGALVVNVGDLLQLITNDRFKSVEHRVLANHVGPRISVASFLNTHFQSSTRRFGPIKELTSEEDPPRYREVTIHEYSACLYSIGLGAGSPLKYFKR